MSLTSPLVTIYVPCRNYGKFLDKALESLEKQIYTNWELFIIDEASEDNTLVASEYFKAKVSQNVEIIKNSTPQGLQKGANKVLGLAKGKYIIRLDADDWFDEMALLLMVSKLESDSSLGIVYGNYYYADEKGNILGFERRHKLGEEDTSHHLPPHGACTMIKTNILKSAGGYSEDVNAQDGWELWFKLIQKTKAASIEAPIFYYRQHGSSLSRDSKRLLDARAKIFDNVSSSLKSGAYQPTCLAVIPVKESYPNFKNVPYQKIDGKNLLQLSVESAQDAKNITEVMISTESENVIRFAHELEKNGTIKKHMRVKRPERLATESLHPLNILEHALNEYQKMHNNYPDIVLFLSLHAPYRKAIHVDMAINVLHVQSCDSVVSVLEEREPMFTHGQQGLNLINPGRFKGLSYEREKLYRFNGSVIATWAEHILNGSLFGDKIGYIEMSNEDSFQIKSNSKSTSIASNVK